MGKIIEVNDLCFRYYEHDPWTIDSVSLFVNEGEWLSIIGHNGSGKSTLAKCLNGLLLPEEGSVKIGGLDTRDELAIWDIRRQVGMVFQNPDNQFVGTTVKDDVAFGMENHGIPRNDMIVRLDEALKLVQMEEYAAEEPHRLSGGQKQRVAIAGIIALSPSIIILDEATSMLDPQGRQEIIETMRYLNKENNITVLSITHDLEEAIYSDRMIVMNQGKVLREGLPSEIFKEAKMLEDIGLDLPFTVKMRQALSKLGVPLSENALLQEELVEELWTLQSKI
ncbi:energy-coupling factor transport system ATP-binding protein [Scopulibacillus darangshiensis]|uniref:Energy-coupling factor transport system ATP-binding protein n=1 Tax=Scopulibacillus darangshiensis TaxID=442528 RepID=A0A4R2NRR2_9BACL|nr:energy-coupling factor ABC transporter ATP-binding protein [Scopulibacillus darangshiensis]TCP24191.1 energy-coupling factor transport system ATP-binding protein [Scopulibacillus darangshiensis]